MRRVGIANPSFILPNPSIIVQHLPANEHVQTQPPGAVGVFERVHHAHTQAAQATKNQLHFDHPLSNRYCVIYIKMHNTPCQHTHEKATATQPAIRATNRHRIETFNSTSVNERSVLLSLSLTHHLTAVNATPTHSQTSGIAASCTASRMGKKKLIDISRLALLLFLPDYPASPALIIRQPFSIRVQNRRFASRTR